ncbi:MAG: archease [Caldilinea sp.]|jgi:SHS2 domain-containing protein|uniref:archease n=1 Tax=Caldilinea sp. TaxID=2293560 RepID=UPI0030A5E9FD
MGYEEIEHTADWALRVWAPDLPELLSEAARGMNALAGVKLNTTNRASRPIHLTAPDAESLLVAFLSELLYLAEQENLAFDSFDLNIDAQAQDGLQLDGVLHGASIAEISKAIKAVTFHNLHIQKTPDGLEATVVFDV